MTQFDVVDGFVYPYALGDRVYATLNDKRQIIYSGPCRDSFHTIHHPQGRYRKDYPGAVREFIYATVKGINYVNERLKELEEKLGAGESRLCIAKGNFKHNEETVGIRIITWSE